MNRPQPEQLWLTSEGREGPLSDRSDVVEGRWLTSEGAEGPVSDLSDVGVVGEGSGKRKGRRGWFVVSVGGWGDRDWRLLLCCLWLGLRGARRRRVRRVGLMMGGLPWWLGRGSMLMGALMRG